MSVFDQWSTNLQQTFKTLSEASNWKSVEVLGELASSEAKIAEKMLHQQNRYVTDSISQMNQHLASVVSQPNPLAAAQANYSFFCDQQVKANSQYLAALDLMGEAKNLMNEKMNTLFVR